VKIIRGFRENSLVKAIVLRVDSPGGAVGASEEIYREALKAREVNGKVVVASMGNVAASGGYYVSCAAQEIFSNGGTITGSIGVIMLDWNVEEIMRRVGVESVVVKSGRHKDSGSPFRGMTPEDRNLFQGLIFDTYRQFCTVVLRARHNALEAALRTRPGEVADALSTATTSSGAGGLEWEAFTTGTVARAAGATTDTETLLRWIADGRVLTGDQALTLGLVDKIGTLDDAVVRAGKLAGLGAKPAVVERRPESRIPSLLGISAREFWQEFSRKGPTVQMRQDGD
jgi:protease-4